MSLCSTYLPKQNSTLFSSPSLAAQGGEWMFRNVPLRRPERSSKPRYCQLGFVISCFRLVLRREKRKDHICRPTKYLIYAGEAPITSGDCMPTASGGTGVTLWRLWSCETGTAVFFATYRQSCIASRNYLLRPFDRFKSLRQLRKTGANRSEIGAEGQKYPSSPNAPGPQGDAPSHEPKSENGRAGMKGSD